MPLFGVKAPKTAPGPFFRAGKAQKAFETAGAVLGGGGGRVLTVFGFCALPLAWFYDVAAGILTVSWDSLMSRTH